MARSSHKALRLASLLALLAGGAWAAGPKSNGAIVVLDDSLVGLSGPVDVSGGGSTVVGGLATPGPVRASSIRDSFVDGGFYAFPFPFSRLLMLVPGEAPLAGPPPGKLGQADAHVKGSTFSVTVYAADWFFQPVADVPGHSIRLSTIAAGETAPPAQTLAGGATTFTGFSVVNTTGTLSLVATDLTNPAIESSTSTFSVVPPATSSPTVQMNVAQDGTYLTLGGGLSGTAFDPSGVQRVQVAIRRVDTGLYYDRPAHVFNLAAQTLLDASLGARGATFTTWFYQLPDADLADGARYAVELIAENPSAFRVPSISTFTFDARGLTFAPDDGKASAFAVPVSSAGCETLTATVTVTLSGAGIRPGGALALKLPSGWTKPAALTAAAPSSPGEVQIVSTAPAFALAGATTPLLNPATFGGASLGDGWIVVSVTGTAAGGIDPGQQVVFAARARPPLGALGRGPQVFEVRTQAYSTGTLSAIASPPSVDLTTGTALTLSFRDAAAIAIGPLQTSPTMQIETLDLCGNPAPPPAGLTVDLQAGSIDGAGNFVVDGSASFFAEQTGLGLTQRFVFPPNTRPASPGGFYYRTSAAGPAAQYVRLVGGTIVSDAYRFVDVRASTVGIGGVSVDTGTLSPGTTSVSLTPGVPAVVRFRLADPSVPWEVLVATGSGFESPLFRANGYGQAAPVAVTWPGLDGRTSPARFAAPGIYQILVRAGGGSAENRTLEARVPFSAYVYGDVGTGGAGAVVRAQGAGAQPGSYAVASSTGWFEIYGLEQGRPYSIAAATRTLVLGQEVELSTAAGAPVTALSSGASAGSLAFTTPGAFRVSVGLPQLAPAELIGRVAVHNPDFSLQASGSLHFSAGSARSDSGGRAFGQTSSTWTVLAVSPGTYDLDVSVPQLGLSTTVANRTLTAGQVSDLQLFFTRKANLSGWAILPSTTAFGSWVSVQATRAGDPSPSVYGGAYVPPAPPIR
ncbi:MAG: hypothetical protein HY925_13925 [Elusimicrobia bacterium]|nr:hypothetical protein [Elusimicrobiota bacterium]